MEAVHAFDLLAAVLRDGEPIADRDAPDHQDLLVKHDLADRLDLKALRIDLDVTRFQRAGEGAGQSAAGGGDYVVKRGRVRRILLGRDAIVLGDLRVHPKHHRLSLCGEVREPLRAAEPLDPYPRNVRRCFSHQPSLAGRLDLFALSVRGACVPVRAPMRRVLLMHAIGMMSARQALDRIPATRSATRSTSTASALRRYGTFATVIGLLTWLYLGARIVVYSAEVNAVLPRRLWPRSLFDPPEAADRNALRALAEIEERHDVENVAVSYKAPDHAAQCQTAPPDGDRSDDNSSRASA